MLTNLVKDTRSGRSQVLVLRGEAGIGKTALLQFLITRAEGCRVSRAAGVESEMELPFASLHQLCAPFLDRLDTLPPPQSQALKTTFGLAPGHAPDRFLVGLAVLTLLCGVAEEEPLICVVDDAQWLDHASTQTLEFVARRLTAEPVAMVFAFRDTEEAAPLSGLPELVLRGLDGRDAAALLESVVAGGMDVKMRDRILAESQGNPLALLELPRELPAAELILGSSRQRRTATPLISRLERGFARQLDALPSPSRELLLLAAAEPLGDVPLLWRAAEVLGLGSDALGAAESAGLLEAQDRVRFRHPLVRSAVYRAADSTERRKVHEALASVTDPGQDPDRRAWHRAKAAVGPDEGVAAELEQSADRALGRGGLTAAAAFLEAAAALTPDPGARAQRALRAAQAKAIIGAFDDALALLALAQVGPLEEPEAARVELLNAQITYHSKHGNEGLPMLLAAAQRVMPIDPKLARETYLDALAAAMFAGRLASGPEIGMQQVAHAMRQVDLPTTGEKSDELLRGIASLYTDGYAAAAPDLLRTVRAFSTEELTMDEAVRFAWLAACAATDLWDDAGWDILTKRHLQAIRDIGALSVLPVALNSRIIYDLCSGALADASSLVAECRWVAEITGGQNAMAPYGEVCLSAIRGQAAAVEPQFRQLREDVTARGEGVGLNLMSWFQAIMYNSLGRYKDALDAATVGAASPHELGPPKWAIAELVEAAVRSGRSNEAASAFELLSSFTQASRTTAALGIEASKRALLRSGTAAEESYQEAIALLGQTTLRMEFARAQLLYGEWLRREGRRSDARTHLRSAFESFSGMDVAGFAERARLELSATGEKVRKRTAETGADLTSQEAHIARLAAEGLTNPEIGAALYISPRTVEWHLRKIFTKLGVSTRRQLRQSLADDAPDAWGVTPGG